MIVILTVFTEYIIPCSYLTTDNQLVLKCIAIFIGGSVDIHFHYALHKNPRPVFFWNTSILTVALFGIWVMLQFTLTREQQLYIIIILMMLMCIYNFIYLTDFTKLYKTKTIELKKV